MPKLLIERELPGAGSLSAPQLWRSRRVGRRAERDGTLDPVGAELRRGRRALLHLHGARTATPSTKPSSCSEKTDQLS